MVRRFIAGILFPTIAFLPSCTGTHLDDGTADGTNAPLSSTAAERSVSDPTAAAVAEEPPVEASAGTQDPQDPQGRMSQQRLRTTVQSLIEEAERALQLRLFQDALFSAGQALELDPGNPDARRIVQSVQQILGQDESQRVAREIDDPIIRERLAQERARDRAIREIEAGQALMDAGQPTQAIERFELALLILRGSPFSQAGSDLENRAQILLENARKSASEVMRQQDLEAQARSDEDLERAREIERIRRDSRIKSLMQEANSAFQVGNYDIAIDRLDDVLVLDPDNRDALSLRELAGRARHTQQRDILRGRWKQEWARVFDDLKQSLLPQTEVIEFDDLERWRQVSQREPLQFSSTEVIDDEQELAIMQRLEETIVEHRFQSAAIEDWVTYYRQVTDVNFVITPSVTEELDESATTLENFSLPARSVRSALDVIARTTGVKWRVRNGAVELLSSDAPVGRVRMVPYQVSDIVLGVRSKPGPDLKLKTGSEPEPFFDEEEPAPTVVDDGQLTDLITTSISPDTWDEIGTISYSKGVLLVRNTDEVHKQIRQLLSDLRKAVGIQIDIESRFLRVADNFLEDVGVDFRGLGDQSAEGLAGRGLEGQPNFAFDDFGPPATLNVVNPGSIGSGTEPGVLYNDGQDGAYLGRTENLFDEALGGDSGLDNLGGLSLQYAWLDDTEIEVILRAVAKQERSQQITAPRLLVYNNTRANVNAVRQTSYIKDFDVEIAQAAAIANPVVDVVRDGVVLDVRPVVSADRRFITMELRPTVLTLQLPIPTFTTTLGTGQPVNIQLPTVTLQRVRTTVTMPDGGTLLLGGMKMANRTNQTSGVPILKDIPIVSFLFSRTGTFVQNEKIIVLVRASIVLNDEFYPEVPADPYDDVLLSSTR